MVGGGDFAFRKVSGTSGVQPRQAQALLRHTDINLTMQTYTDPRVFDLTGAVESLPDLKDQPAKQTGGREVGYGKKADSPIE